MADFYEWYEAIRAFMLAGGDVLFLVAILTFVMWTLTFERLWYFRSGHKKAVAHAMEVWEGRDERVSWNAHQIRLKLISEVRMAIESSMPVIHTCVAVAPMIGLLGTVTGMIEVFHVMAVTGGSDAKSMACGVSKATIPTMAGMVTALSGILATSVLDRTVSRECELLEDHLTMDH